MATNSLLQYENFHPKHLKDGIPVGQFARLKRNCSAFEEFSKQALDLTERFQKRGHPRCVISKAYRKAKFSYRATVLTPKIRSTESALRIVTTFNNQWVDVKNILHRNWNILTNDTCMSNFIPTKPQLTAKRTRNIGDRVTKSHFEPPQVSLGHGLKLCGTFACGNCSICAFCLNKAEFVNPTDNRTITLLRNTWLYKEGGPWLGERV